MSSLQQDFATPSGFVMRFIDGVPVEDGNRRPGFERLKAPTIERARAIVPVISFRLMRFDIATSIAAAEAQRLEPTTVRVRSYATSTGVNRNTFSR